MDYYTMKEEFMHLQVVLATMNHPLLTNVSTMIFFLENGLKLLIAFIKQVDQDLQYLIKNISTSLEVKMIW